LEIAGSLRRGILGLLFTHYARPHTKILTLPAAGLVLPRCNTEGMTLHLAGIAATIAPGAHAVLLLEQAGWHVSEALVVPPNITLLLAFKCPVLNWQEPSGSTCATTGS
jgi:hypothetical protein